MPPQQPPQPPPRKVRSACSDLRRGLSCLGSVPGHV
jgi:hypothetical protein